MLQRHHTNHITHLISDQGMEIQKHAEIEKELLTYYKHLFLEPQIDHTKAIESVSTRICTKKFGYFYDLFCNTDELRDFVVPAS